MRALYAEPKRLGARWRKILRFFLTVAAFLPLGCSSENEERTAPTLAAATEQVEIVQPGPLLDVDGTLHQAGWSRTEVLAYNPEAIPAGERKRLREWDFFAIQNTQGSLSLTATNLGFITLCSADWLDFKTGKTATAALPKLSDEEYIVLSAHAHGNTRCGKAGEAEPRLEFTTAGTERRLHFDFPKNALGPAMRGTFVIREHPRQEYLALATPFAADRFAFFYEQKIAGTVAEGVMQAGATNYTFAATETVAFMDWGRGVWPEQLLWHWGGAGGRLADGRRFGLNLGNGFGEMSAATENLFVIEGKAHKLGEVDWIYDREHADEPWRFRSGDGAVELTLTTERAVRNGINLMFKYSALTKTHGRLRGRIRLSDGETVTLDTPTAFAEEMQIRW